MTKCKLFILTAIAFLLTFATVQATEYNVVIPVKGKTIAGEELQRNSLFTVYSFAVRTAPATCQQFSIVDTNVTKAKENGAWEEVWTVSACERNVNIPISFTDKGTYSVNPMGVKYTELLAK